MLRETLLQEIPELKVHGRTTDCRSPLVLFWTAGGFECNVTGSELWVELEVSYTACEPWFSYTVNGDWVGRQMLPAGRYWVPLFRGMSADTVKNVHFYKDLQPMSGDGESFILVHALRHNGRFLPVPEKSLKLEFIGDSITSGEGLFGAKQEQDWIPMFFSAIKDYACQTAERLDAEYRVFSQSGWGVHCAWDGDPHGALPKHYRQICSLIPGEKNEALGGNRPHDFASWQPDCVVVNLGTNDASALGQGANGLFDRRGVELFRRDVKDFLQVLRECNPAAHIVWCVGMLGTGLWQQICETLEEYRAETGDENISGLQLTEATEETIGSRGHPGYLCHKQAAETLAGHIEERLGRTAV